MRLLMAPLLGASLLFSSLAYAQFTYTDKGFAGPEDYFAQADAYFDEGEVGRAGALLRDVAYAPNEAPAEDVFKAYEKLVSYRTTLAKKAGFTLKDIQGEGTHPAGYLRLKNGDVEGGLAHLMQEAKLLDRRAFAVLALLYERGMEGLPPYDTRILTHFESMAEEGWPRDQMQVGSIYLSGLGVAQDATRGLAMLNKVAGQLDGAAHIKLAEYYFTKSNREKFIEHVIEAAHLNHPKGLYNVGVMFKESGEPGKAIAYFNRTLDANPQHYEAMMNLGQIYMDNATTDKEQYAAFTYYQRAADEGLNPVAQFVVGNMYANGAGVPQNVEKAKTYYSRSAAQGFGLAMEKLEKLPK